MKVQSRVRQSSDAMSVSYAIIHVIIVITLVIGFDVWVILKVWG